jgi:hypothetical protein
MEGYRILLFLVFTILILGGIIFIYALQSKRALFKVIGIFCQHEALRMSDAKTLRELGLERPDFFQKMMRPRDYKQYALEILIKRGMVLTTEDGKLFLVEDKLDQRLRDKVSEIRAKGKSRREKAA